MKVSVIIPTLNGSKTIGNVLKGITAQGRMPDEIIVVDSSSEDDTVRIVRGFGIEPLIIRREDFDHGGTRNMAARLAKGEIIVFMTQDSIPCDETLLENLTLPIRKNVIEHPHPRRSPESFGPNPPVSPFSKGGIKRGSRGRETNNFTHKYSPSPGGNHPPVSPLAKGGTEGGLGGDELLQKDVVAASFGRHVPMSNASAIERFARSYNYPEDAVIKSKKDEPRLGIKTYFFSNACSAISRDAFEKVGGFPDKTPMNEDMILSYNLIASGYSVAYVPEARVYHSHNYSPLRQFKKHYLIASSLVESGLAEKVQVHGEGFRFFREGFKFLLKEGEYGYVPLFMVDNLCRYIGFNLGLRRK